MYQLRVGNSLFAEARSGGAHMSSFAIDEPRGFLGPLDKLGSSSYDNPPTILTSSYIMVCAFWNGKSKLVEVHGAIRSKRQREVFNLIILKKHAPVGSIYKIKYRIGKFINTRNYATFDYILAGKI